MIKSTLLFFVCTTLLACQSADRTNKMDDSKSEKMTNISQIVHEASDEWIDKEGVVAVAVGEKDGKECIQVFLSQPKELMSFTFPENYKGFPVVVQYSGDIHIQGAEEGE